LFVSTEAGIGLLGGFSGLLVGWLAGWLLTHRPVLHAPRSPHSKAPGAEIPPSVYTPPIGARPAFSAVIGVASGVIGIARHVSTRSGLALRVAAFHGRCSTLSFRPFRPDEWLASG
jgi:hypothetical protein